MGPVEMEQIATLLGRALGERNDEAALQAVRADVAALCARFDPYPTLAGQE